MKIILKTISKKIEYMNSKFSEEELKLLQLDLEQRLVLEESKSNPSYKKIDKLHILIGFLGAWGLAKRENCIPSP